MYSLISKGVQDKQEEQKLGLSQEDLLQSIGDSMMSDASLEIENENKTERSNSMESVRESLYAERKTEHMKMGDLL